MKQKKILILLHISLIICLITKTIYGYNDEYKTNELLALSGDIYDFINLVFLILIPLTILSLYSIYKINIKENTEEEIEKEKKKFNILKLFFSITLCTFIYLLYMLFWTDYPFNKVLLYIPAMIFILAIITKLLKHKIIGNIMCVINIICMILIGSIYAKPVKKVIEYNNKISKYIQDTGYQKLPDDDSNVSDIKGLIGTIIEINKSDRKISVQYGNKTYASEEELKKLRDTINTEFSYNAKESYDKNGTYKKGKYDKANQIYYVESIKLRVAFGNAEFRKYIGSSRSGSQVKQMIDSITTDNGYQKYLISIHAENIKGFDSKALDEACYNLNIYKNKNAEYTAENINIAKAEMQKLKKIVSANKKYNIEFLEDTYTIVITGQN